MKFTGNRLKKLTFVKVTGYLFAFAVCAKVVALYASQHTIKEELLFVRKLYLRDDG
jgi:hypothetical protein